MHAKKLGFLLSMALVASAILATRIQEVDVPIWQRFADANRVNPLTLHLQGEFVESNLGTAREPDGSFTLRMIAEQYMFVPHCVLFRCIYGSPAPTWCIRSPSPVPITG